MEQILHLKLSSVETESGRLCSEEGEKKNMLGRIIFGNDAPSGTGLIPLGIIEMSAR